MTWELELMRWLNQELTHPWLDAVMPTLTSSATYRVPGLVAVLWFLVRGTARTRALVLGLALCVGATDLMSSKVVKPLVGRQRPHWTQDSVRLLIGAKKSYSLPSSHAANLAAAAWFVHRTFAQRWVFYAMLLVLGIISYSRIYVGVHYPTDVLAGALLGPMVAEAVLRLPWLRRLRLRRGAAGNERSGPAGGPQGGEALAHRNGHPRRIAAADGLDRGRGSD